MRREETKEGTDVIIWSKTGNMNQKWQIENKMIRSRTGNDLNVTKLVNGFLGVWHTGDYAQKWRFVPETMWDAYELYLLNNNPVMKFMFLKTIICDHLKCVLGCVSTNPGKNKNGLKVIRFCVAFPPTHLKNG